MIINVRSEKNGCICVDLVEKIVVKIIISEFLYLIITFIKKEHK